MAKAKTEGVERVDVFVPRGAVGEEKSVFISVNGENYLLPRGKTSNVPAYIAYEFKRSQEAQNNWDDLAEGMANTESALN